MRRRFPGFRDLVNWVTAGPAPSGQGSLAPWGVFLDQEQGWMTIAQPVRGSWTPIWSSGRTSSPGSLSPWRSSMTVTASPCLTRAWLAGYGPRNRLREQLARHVQNRTLPVVPASPLAAERAWFLAQQIMAKGRTGRPRQEYSMGDLRQEVDALMAHVENTRRSRWQWGRRRSRRRGVTAARGRPGRGSGRRCFVWGPGPCDGGCRRCGRRRRG